MVNNPLFDQSFLKKLDNDNNKEIYARIRIVDNDGMPQESIEGAIQVGQITIDGSSATRRSCSLTIKAIPETPITDIYWGLKNQFQLEIGVKNNINKMYPDIIWFKQGVFVVTSFSKQVSASELQVSISGQDKMCLLDGSIGGVLTENIDFGEIDIYEKDGTKRTEKLPLFTIIQRSLSEFGQERLDKIIINDLDFYGLEALEYKGNTPLYLIYEPLTEDLFSGAGIFRGMTMDPSTNVWLSSEQAIHISELDQYYKLNCLDPLENKGATNVAYSNKTKNNCVVVKVEYGETIGYRSSILLYAGDLISSPNSSLKDMLDKIKTQLVNYEFFYDLDGNFVFQKTKNYIQELFSPISGDIVEPQMMTSPYSYSFDDTQKIISISYSPEIKTLRNDFSVWGERNGSNGKVSIQVRYAIDKKPTSYYDYNGLIFYYTSEFSGNFPHFAKLVQCDWREIIYQMALDNNRFNEKEDFFIKLKDHNNYVKNTKTGYEDYYTTILSKWRELYYMGNNINEIPPGYTKNDYYPKGHKYAFWHKNVYTSPNQLNFWFDFLDVGDGNLLKLNKQNCGSRPKVETVKDKFTTIFESNTPEIIFYTNKENLSNSDKRNNTAIWIPEAVEKLFSTTVQPLSLVNQVNEFIYESCCCQEGVSISAIPVYYLEPNTCIYVKDVGDLIVNTITYDLGQSSTMTLSCIKRANSIY